MRQGKIEDDFSNLTDNSPNPIGHKNFGLDKSKIDSLILVKDSDDSSNAFRFLKKDGSTSIIKS